MFALVGGGQRICRRPLEFAFGGRGLSRSGEAGYQDVAPFKDVLDFLGIELTRIANGDKSGSFLINDLMLNGGFVLMIQCQIHDIFRSPGT